MTAICDFCSDPAVVCAFPCRDHSTEADIILVDTRGEGPDIRPALNSLGGWAACEPCKALILAGDRDGLAARSADRYPMPAMPANFRPIIEAEIRKLHDNFWASREGEPVPIAPTDPDPTPTKDRTR